MKLLLVIAFVALVVAALIFARLKLQARARARFAEETQRKLDDLFRAVGAWPGSAYDLVPYDTDQLSNALELAYRSIDIELNDGGKWRLEIALQERYRVAMTLHGQEIWYPSRYEWSDEAWLKRMVDLLLLQIAQLPPPRTWREQSAMERAAVRRLIAQIDEDLAAAQGAGCVPDDGADDME